MKKKSEIEWNELTEKLRRAYEVINALNSDLNQLKLQNEELKKAHDSYRQNFKEQNEEIARLADGKEIDFSGIEFAVRTIRGAVEFLNEEMERVQ